MARGAPASSPGGGLRPASRGSAKPAPTTRGAPVSDRHRAGARNPHQRPVERRSPTGIARERETRTNDPWSAGLRPASRGSAKPAPTTRGAPVSDRHRAGARNPHRRPVERWPALPVGASDRHRAGARNPHQRPVERRSPTGIARERETCTNDPWSAGLRPASRGSAKPAPMTLCHANVRAASFHDGRGCAGGPDHVSLSVPPNSAPTSPCQRFPGTIGTKATPPWS